MKQYFFFALLSSLTLNAQLKLNSISTGLGIFYINNLLKESSVENLQQGGISFTAETIISINKHLISFTYISESELPILGPATFNVNEFNLMYGRNIEATKWLKLEGFAGFGIFSQKDTAYHNSVVSFPLRLNIIFFPRTRINIGLNGNYGINTLNNSLSTHLILRYSFK